MTVLLAAQDSRLVDALRNARPDVRTLAIGPEVPDQPIAGPVWCFVDWLLPEVSGLEMCRRLRHAPATGHGHITLVLEDGDADDRRRALRAGADDYLVGPLDAEKLAQRLDTYRPVAPSPQARGTLRHGEVTIDLAAHQVRYQGAPVPLRPNEFRLLVHFVEHPDRLFSRNELIEQIGKDAGELDERTVDVWVGRLRRALGAHGIPDPLRTVRSLGYVLDSHQT